MFTNPGFWATFGVIFVAAALLTFLIPDNKKERIITTVICVVVSFIAAVLIYSDAAKSADRWNNGIHIDCGGQYQFTSATNWRGSKDYYYTCDKYGHTEEFHSIMR